MHGSCAIMGGLGAHGQGGGGWGDLGGAEFCASCWTALVDIWCSFGTALGAFLGGVLGEVSGPAFVCAKRRIVFCTGHVPYWLLIQNWCKSSLELPSPRYVSPCQFLFKTDESPLWSFLLPQYIFLIQVLFKLMKSFLEPSSFSNNWSLYTSYPQLMNKVLQVRVGKVWFPFDFTKFGIHNVAFP